MDICSDVRYWSNVLFSASHASLYDLQLKVMAKKCMLILCYLYPTQSNSVCVCVCGGGGGGVYVGGGGGA